MDQQDYFGHITVPGNEEEEDAANDLTFGDIGDIKAGGDASGALWKPNHQSLSEKIQAEKQALLQARAKSATSAPLSSPNIIANGQASPIGSLNLSTSRGNSWNQVPSLQQHALPQQSFLRPPVVQPTVVPNPALLHSHVPPFQPHAFHQQPQTQGHFQQTHSLPLQQMPPQYPSHLQQQLNPQDYERTIIAFYEQQARDLLLRHKETAEQQLKDAQAAQRAGVVFDRNKFDEHQHATQQRIIADYYSRVNRVRYLVWRQTQQMMRQNPSLVDQQSSHPKPQDPSNVLMDMLKAQSAPMNNATNIYSKGQPSPAAFAHQLQAIDEQQRRGTLSTSQHLSKSNGVAVQVAPRMLEIERQMAEAGLGPSKKKGAKETFGSFPHENGRKNPPKKGSRRLESMTDKDLELVFRVHLRQVEAAVAYKDDYYNAVFRNNQKVESRKVLSDLAEKVHAMRLRSRQHGGESRPARVRRSKRSGTHKSDHSLASPPHSSHNMRALANALGTVQSWNPRAPRRVMDFGLMERKDSDVEATTEKLLRDDERVHVRQEIERGYDVIATLHDIVRGESLESLEGQIKLLFDTLHLQERQNEEVGNQKTSIRASRYFATMCVIEKGRRYLSRVLDLLDPVERVRVMPAIFENLGAMLFALQKTSAGRPSISCSLFKTIYSTLQDSDVLPQDCLEMLQSFFSSHTSHLDAFLTTFRSRAGAKLIFLCMQRVSRGLLKNDVSKDELSQTSIEQFSNVFTQSLQDIFEGAESVSGVWEVIASLDGLANGEHKALFRGELSRLLRSGAAPPPPET